MKLTPLDIRKQEYKKVMRGYDPVEVDTFMEMMANEFEEVLKSQKDMRDRSVELEIQLKDYRQIEKTLQQTLLQAQEATGRTYESARKEAELITREAEQKGARIVEEAHAQLSRLKNDVMELTSRKESLIGRLRVLLSAELDLLKMLDQENPPDLLKFNPLGTGKESIEVDKIARAIDSDRTTPAH
jgi:cell division initiation protein